MPEPKASPDLAEVLGKINDGICVLTPAGDVAFVNEKASQIFDAADEAFQSRLSQSLRDNAAARFEYFHKPLNRWFEHHIYPNADGGLTLVSCDITSRHRMEEALRASEERFRRVIDSNIIGYVVVENGLVTEANDVFLQILHYTQEDLTRRMLRWREMTPAEYVARDESARLELHSNGRFSPYEKEFYRKDGGRVPVLIGGVAQPHADVHETICLVLDLTERKRAEEQVQSLVEAGKILASSLECEKTLPELAEFIASKLADSCAIFVRGENEAIRVISAHTIPILQEPDPSADVDRIVSTGVSELRQMPTSRILAPIMTRNRISGVLAVGKSKPYAFDADDLHLFEALGRRAGLALEHARLYDEAQKANRLKDEFVAIISHELRTPLTPILGGVYMMRSEPHDETVLARALDLIERNARSQVKIVDDLLDVSRAVSGKLRLNMECVDLGSIVSAAIDTVRPASEAKEIEISTDALTADLRVLGDFDRLQQVVWNLLSNAVKFTPVAGRIVVELREAAGCAEISVSDTGIGIEPKFLPHVFEKFQQADSSRTRAHGGLGLGLAIVRHIVESHGGTVHAQSSGGKQGATFIVRLPLRQNTHAAGS